MTDSFKGFLMLLTVCVFLYILYRKRIKPFIQKIKGAPKEVQPVQTVESAQARYDDEKGTQYIDVMAFDVCGYAELEDLENQIETKVDMRLKHINRNGKLLSVHYVGCGNILFILTNWQV